MQSLSAKALQCGTGLWTEAAGFGPEPGTVGYVPKNRVSDMGEVDPDLVGTPGFEGTGEQASQGLSVWSGETFQHLPMGHCGPTVLTHGLFVAGMRMTSEWGADRSLRTIRRTPNQGQIAALQRAVGLFSELL